jgi:hypothetical protein
MGFAWMSGWRGCLAVETGGGAGGNATSPLVRGEGDATSELLMLPSWDAGAASRENPEPTLPAPTISFDEAPFDTDRGEESCGEVSGCFGWASNKGAATSWVTKGGNEPAANPELADTSQTRVKIVWHPA